MRLMLLRHAKSDWSRPGLSDHDRTLNARGRDAASKVGTYMASHDLVPDLIVASTATRVRETLDLALAAFETAPKVKREARVYEAEPEMLMEIVQDTPRAVGTLLLVGHNPGLAELAFLLVATGKTEARQRLAEKFPTGALAVIDFALDDWRKIHPQSGRLDRFVVPRTLKGETD